MAQASTGMWKSSKDEEVSFAALLWSISSSVQVPMYSQAAKTWPTGDLQDQGVSFATLKNSGEDVHILQLSDKYFNDELNCQ